jgi:hypothetical protein
LNAKDIILIINKVIKKDKENGKMGSKLIK